jgi:hypothetical protein
MDTSYFDEVLEHNCESSVLKWDRMLKPRGLFLALAGLDDRLAHYDESQIDEIIFSIQTVAGNGRFQKICNT